MNRLLTLIAITLIASSFGACKKCYQCVVRDSMQNDEVQYWLEYKEICGSNRDIDAYKILCEERVVTASELSAADTMDLYCDCGEDIQL